MWDWCQKGLWLLLLLLLLLMMLCRQNVFIFTFMTPVSIVKGSLLCKCCHRMFHINCLYTSQMDNLLLYRWSCFFLDSLIACMVLMSWYIGIHSNTNFKGQELMEFKSFVSKLWCQSKMSCDQENAMSTSSNTSSQAIAVILVVVVVVVVL